MDCGRLLLAFGAGLAELRAERRISQDELATRAGMSQPGLSNIENGLRNPPLTTVFRLAKALDMTPAELLAATMEDR